MKCEYCSGNISIEHEKCPFCDAPNPFYEAHRKDMKAYAQKYESTKNKVIDKTNRVTSRSVYVTMIVILAALIILCVITLVMGREFMWNISYEMRDRENKKNAAEYAEVVKELEENGDYTGINTYMDQHYTFYQDSPLFEYTIVSNASGYYTRIVDAISRATGDGYFSSSDELAERVNTALDGLYSLRQEFDRDTYDRPNYDEKHRDAVDDIISESHMLVAAYFGLDEETVNSFPEMSKSRRLVILEEAAREVYFKDYEY